MTITTASHEPRLSGTRPRTDNVLMIATAARGGLTRELRKPWPVFLVNDRINPDARPLITYLIAEGLLYVTHPDRPVSEVAPTPSGLAKIGATA